jgi:hypothetical protein
MKVCGLALRLAVRLTRRARCFIYLSLALKSKSETTLINRGSCIVLAKTAFPRHKGQCLKFTKLMIPSES